QQQQALPPSARPRVVKKLETEDEFQIQIYKPYGNFNNYEVQVIRQQPPLIKIVISGPRQDNFKVENTFNLNYIDIDNINWRWNKRENILSLNIPKKLHYIHLNVEDVLNCLFGGHVFEPESKELQFGHNDEEEEEEEEAEEEDDTEDETLEDHEKIIREAANALKNQFVITPINGSVSAEKKDNKKKKNRNEEAQAKAKAKAEEEEAKAKAKAKAEEEEANAKAKAKAKAEEEEAKAKAKAKAEEEEAKAKAEAIAQRKREILAQQKEAEAKVKQAQLELERLVQQQHELEKQHKSKEAHEVESKEHVLESLIRDEEDKIYENEQEQISQFLSQLNQSKTQSKTQKENQKQQQQQQDFLNQFFGFNLGPALNEYLAHAPIQNQTAKLTQQKHLNQKQNSQRPTRPVKPAKLEKLKLHIINNNEVLNSSKLTGTNLNEALEPKTPILNGKEGNSSKSNTIPKRYSPSMEDVEDEESIMWRKKFDH
ncbi:hypothetical protein PP707_05760, partial [Acetobacter pasteurianus]|nr:hypothetical protein [Acetobacter pasteurianus]